MSGADRSLVTVLRSWTWGKELEWPADKDSLVALDGGDGKVEGGKKGKRGKDNNYHG